MLAICDRNTLAGVVRGHSQAKLDGIRFISGCRLVLGRGVEIASLPADRAAYGRLCRLLSAAHAAAQVAWLSGGLKRETPHDIAYSIAR